MVGAVFVYKYGLPPDVRRTGASYLILEETDKAEKRKGEQYDQLGSMGILLLGLGFFLQLVSNFL